jgi:hypothetical protein
MPKNILQDMVKAKRTRDTKYLNALRPRNIKENPVITERKIIEESGLPDKSDLRIDFKQEYSNKSKKTPKYMLWFVAVVSALFLFFALSYSFSKVVVTLNPKIKETALNQNISSSLTGTDENDAAPFDLVAISGEENRTIPTTFQKDVLKKAEGVIVIYNTFNSSSQKLSIDTRLSGSNGKIYKTKSQIVVPGKSKDGKPGSIEVLIYADEPGESYNSGPIDFKIMGFKGTPRYEKFYGRSKGPISGGFKGKMGDISETEKAGVINNMKEVLSDKLLKKATSQIPSGFILFKDAVFLDVDSDNVNFSSSSDDNTLSMKMKGTLYGILLSEEKLTKKIVSENITNYDGIPVYIPNIKNLTFTLLNKDNPIFSDVKKIDFNLKGSIKIAWKVDTDKLSSDLLGKPKKDFTKILLAYPNINSADLSISPVWKMSIPDKSDNVKIIVNYPE